MKSGCECKAMDSGDPKQMEAHCERDFIPQGWTIGRKLEGQRYVLLDGICARCGRELSQGFALPEGTDREEFFSLVYDVLIAWRPFQVKGTRPHACGTPAERRAYWYREQDSITPAARSERFLSLFEGEERDAAERWLNKRGG